MVFSRQKLIQRITDNIDFLSGHVKKENLIGLFDSNRLAQDFYKDFLGLVFGYKNLVDLDKLNEKTNYKAIDLAETNERVAIQVTSENTSQKIKDTIKKFNEEKLYNDYDRLVILIIGTRKNYSTSFSTENKFEFDQDDDIWDDSSLISEIDNLDDDQLTAIDNLLKSKLEDYKSPDHLDYDDIAECINYIKKAIDSWLLSAVDKARTLPPARDDEYIIRKNLANGITEDFFKQNILGHLRHNDLMEEFLRDPVNANNGSLDNYYLVTQSIQNFYDEHSAEFKNFEEVFVLVFNQITGDYHSATNPNKVKIVLHNMYFNCDIGDDPDD